MNSPITLVIKSVICFEGDLMQNFKLELSNGKKKKKGSFIPLLPLGSIIDDFRCKHKKNSIVFCFFCF